MTDCHIGDAFTVIVVISLHTHQVYLHGAHCELIVVTRNVKTKLKIPTLSINWHWRFEVANVFLFFLRIRVHERSCFMWSALGRDANKSVADVDAVT